MSAARVDRPHLHEPPGAMGDADRSAATPRGVDPTSRALAARGRAGRAAATRCTSDRAPSESRGGRRSCRHAGRGGARRAQHLVREAREADAFHGAGATHHVDGWRRQIHVGALELDDHRPVGMAREHVGQAGDADVGAAIGEGALRAEPETGVDARELGRRVGRDCAARVGGAIEGAVVDDDDLAVLREAHVELEAVDTELGRTVERGHRVLGPEAGAAPMREHQRAASRPCARDPGRLARRVSQADTGDGSHPHDSIATWPPLCPRRSVLYGMRWMPARSRAARSVARFATTSSPACASRRHHLSRHRRLRRDGRAAGGQRDPVAPQFHPARPARSGQDAAAARADDAARRVAAGRAGLRDQRRPAGAAQRLSPRRGCARRATPADSLAAAGGALRREAGDART